MPIMLAPFAGQHPDHPESDVLDPDLLAHRGLALEQFPDEALAHEADPVAVEHIPCR